MPMPMWKSGRYPLLLGDWLAWLAEGDELGHLEKGTLPFFM